MGTLSVEGWDDGVVDFLLGLELPQGDEESEYMQAYRRGRAHCEEVDLLRRGWGRRIEA